MQINDIQHFDIVKTYIPSNNFTPVIINQNRHPVVKL